MLIGKGENSHENVSISDSHIMLLVNCLTRNHRVKYVHVNIHVHTSLYG